MLFVCLFVCFFWGFRTTRDFLTHMETSPLPLKGCKFWPIFGVSGIFEDTWHSPISERLAVELSLLIFAVSRLIFEYTTFFLQGERSNRLCHRRGLLAFNSKYKFQCLDWTEAESNIVRRRIQNKTSALLVHIVL